MDKWIEQKFLEGSINMWRNLLTHKGSTNQNDTEIPSHPCLNGYHQVNNTNAGEDVWGKEAIYTLLVGM
jgi:hypothetical protein